MKSSVSSQRKRRRHPFSAGLLRKYRRLRHRLSLRQEYKKLRSLLPLTPHSPALKHKAGVVDAAYRYICHLQAALISKFSKRGVPGDLVGVVGEKISSPADIQALALHIIQAAQTNKQQRQPVQPQSHSR